jgi:hypothetical protein
MTRVSLAESPSNAGVESLCVNNSCSRKAKAARLRHFSNIGFICGFAGARNCDGRSPARKRRGGYARRNVPNAIEMIDKIT